MSILPRATLGWGVRLYPNDVEALQGDADEPSPMDRLSALVERFPLLGMTEGGDLSTSDGEGGALVYAEVTLTESGSTFVTPVSFLRTAVALTDGWGPGVPAVEQLSALWEQIGRPKVDVPGWYLVATRG